VRELFVDLDDDARRLAWSVADGAFTHHNASAQVVADGDGTLRPGGVPPVAVAGRPVVVSVPLEPVATLVGRRGVSESIARQRLVIDTRGEIVLRLK